MMNRFARKTLLALALLLTIAATLCITALAHEPIVKEVEPGKLHFFFDDGSPMSEAFITVYTKAGEQIATAQADADGYFVYTSYEGAGKISGGDASGHLVFFNIKTPVAQETAPEADSDTPEPQTPAQGEDTNRQLTIVAVLTALGVIAFVSYANNKKKAQKAKK